MSSLPKKSAIITPIDQEEIEFRMRSKSTVMEYPKNFVPGLKPIKSLTKPSPLIKKKSSKKIKRFNLDTEAMSADENEIDDFSDEDFSNNLKEEKEEPFANVNIARSSLKKTRLNTKNAFCKDDIELGAPNNFLKLVEEEMAIPIKRKCFKSLSLKVSGNSDLSKFMFDYEHNPLLKFKTFNKDGLLTPNKDRSGSSLYYWSLEKRKSSSILGFLEVNSLEKMENKINEEIQRQSKKN